MPEGVESSIYHPYARIETGRPFRFLMLGKYERRKSFHETIQAFAQVFANQPDVELFIKSHTFGDADLATRDLLGTLDGLGLQNVGVYWGEMNRNQLAELYRDSDVFVFPSKGEGWGLPLIEAAASGLPIITTMYSGQTEFLEPIKSSVIPVDYVLVPVDCPDYQRDYPGSDNNYGAWARPDPYSIADAMKTAKNNYKKLSKNALKNSQIIRKNYSWAQCAEKALAAMESNGWL
jgi:glycosyltransferase involved in cell wall biosynthesis